MGLRYSGARSSTVRLEGAVWSNVQIENNMGSRCDVNEFFQEQLRDRIDSGAFQFWIDLFQGVPE